MSVLLRMEGNIEASQYAVRAYLSAYDENLGGPLVPHHCLALYHSQANNYIYRFQFNEAYDLLQKLSLRAYALGSGPASHFLLWDRTMCLGRIMQGQGKFEAARECFQKCLETPFLPKQMRYLAIAAFADISCELAEQDGSQR